jgi:hypothetical protein
VKILRNYINYYKQHPIKPNFDIGVDENYRIIDNNNIESYNSQKKYGTYTGEIIGNSLYVFDMPWIGHFAGWNSPTALIRSSDDTILDKKIMLYEHRFNMPFYWGYGTLICTSNSGLISSSGKFSYSSFKISESGKIEIEMNSQPSCMFYMEMDSDVYDEVYKIFSLNENPIDMFNVEDAVKAMTIANLTTKFTLEAVPTTQELDLKIKDYSIIGNQIMFLVKNTGNVEATVNDIQSDIPLTVLEKTKVKPGETTEVYAKLEDIPRSDRINFNLVYKTDELGCLKTKEYGVKTGFIGCKSDFQCSSILNSGICCEGSCKDSREGVCRDENGDGLMEWILFG